MKHLFIARHGNYSKIKEEYRLNDSGRQQMEFLGKSMKEILKGGSAKIISSTAPRALDSSEVLVPQLISPGFKAISYLWSGGDAPRGSFGDIPNLEELMIILNDEKDDAEGLIIVTHLEIVKSFSSYYFKKEFGGTEIVMPPSKGQAVHFDLEGRTYQILPR